MSKEHTITQIRKLLTEVRDVQLRRLERAWKSDPGDVGTRNRYARALVRLGTHLDDEDTSPRTGVNLRRHIRGAAFPATRHSNANDPPILGPVRRNRGPLSRIIDIPPEEISPTTTLGYRFASSDPTPPVTEYSPENYIIPLFERIVTSLTRRRHRTVGMIGSEGHHRTGWDVPYGSTSDGITGTYTVRKIKYRVYADYTSASQQTRESGWGFGKLVVRMEQGGLGEDKSWRKSSKKKWACNAYATIDVEGPAYRLDSGQARSPGQDHLGGYVSRSPLPAGASRQWGGSSTGVRRIHKFRDGKEILKLLQKELARICSLAFKAYKPRDYSRDKTSHSQSDADREMMLRSIKRDRIRRQIAGEHEPNPESSDRRLNPYYQP